MDVPEEVYANIREYLGDFIGKRIAEITQHDREDWEQRREAYVMLIFDDGSVLKFHQGDEGFQSYEPGGYEGNDPTPEDSD